jgi:hypothetical protein
MDYQVKSFSGLDRGNYIVVIARGSVDIVGLAELFDKTADATRSLLDCKVLIDLQDAILRILPSDLGRFFGKFDFTKWPHQNKTALVSSSEINQYKQLLMVGENLVQMRLDVGLFYDERDAIKWLSGICGV